MGETSKARCVAVFGGTGFLGAEIVRCLAARGIKARVAVRHPDDAKAKVLSTQSDLVEPICADVRDETSVALALQGCNAVVNAVGLYVERGGTNFEAVHEIGALNVAHQAAALGLKRVVLISGIGADRYSSSSYVRSRGKGELLVADVFERATILRPSVLFGRGEDVLNTLTKIIAVSPLIPLFGRGEFRLQPVFVGDVAEAVCNAIDDESTCGKTYELGGPDSLSYRELIELLMVHTERKRLLMPIPFVVWDMLAVAASILPKPPITRAQVALMKRDNVVSGSELSLSDLGVTPTALVSFLKQHATSSLTNAS